MYGLHPPARLSAARIPATHTAAPRSVMCIIDIIRQGQFKIGNGAFYGLNYIQSVTPALSMGGEAFWLGTQRKSGIGFAARHATDKHVGTVQVATTGLVSLTYVHNVSEKVHLATDFLYNWNSREARLGPLCRQALPPAQPAPRSPRTSRALRLCAAEEPCPSDADTPPLYPRTPQRTPSPGHGRRRRRASGTTTSSGSAASGAASTPTGRLPRTWRSG